MNSYRNRTNIHRAASEWHPLICFAENSPDIFQKLNFKRRFSVELSSEDLSVEVSLFQIWSEFSSTTWYSLDCFVFYFSGHFKWPHSPMRPTICRHWNSNCGDAIVIRYRRDRFQLFWVFAQVFVRSFSQIVIQKTHPIAVISMHKIQNPNSRATNFVGNHNRKIENDRFLRFPRAGHH